MGGDRSALIRPMFEDLKGCRQLLGWTHWTRGDEVKDGLKYYPVMV